MSDEIIIRCKNCKHWRYDKTCNILFDKLYYELFVPPLSLQIYKDMYELAGCWFYVRTADEFSCINAKLKD